MKKFRISFLGVLAIIIGLMASSFSVKQGTKTGSGVWFTYNGGTKSLQASYDPAGGDPMCDNTEKLCAIRATDDNGRPDNTELQALFNSGALDQPGNSDVEFGDIP